MSDEITPIVVVASYNSRDVLPKNVINVVCGHSGTKDVRFICREHPTDQYKTEWEIDPSTSGKNRYFSDLDSVTREEFIEHLKEHWPADFNAILWNPELLDCEYHGDNDDK